MAGAQHDTLAGGGEMGERIRAFDWSSTPLGPISEWRQSLKTALSLILNAQMPMWLGWTPEMYFFYNDAYIQVLSHAKHPWALGRPAQDVWKEIWHVCGPLADRVFGKGEAPFLEDVRLFMDRGGGFLEEVYYSFSYSPIRDETGVAGLFCPNTEVTAKLLHARRLRTLSELSEKALVEKTIEAAVGTAAATLAENPDDVPFASVYLADEHGALALAETVTIDTTSRGWPVDDVFATGKPRRIELGDGAPLGLAERPIREAIMLPIASTGQTSHGVLVAGVSSVRRLDAEYTTFFELVAGQIAVAIQNALAAEQSKRRADMLAEIDRAKTVFFSNVSHELRTPLTLMIGPTEDALGSPEQTLGGEALQTVYRNELRLLKLVNGLLDFSRIEAGRMSATYEPVDLAALTADLASGFRSAIERAGLAFVVDTPPLGHPVAVDRDMWEKIVLNLLSNALKFTLAGQISIALRATPANEIELVVGDTGTGVPAAHLPRLFERFHRVENPHARTQEGTGIGLALVSELAKLHGGRVEVTSEVGHGSTFTVTIPRRGVATEVGPQRSAPNLPLGRMSAALEAERWMPAESPAVQHPAGTPRVLLADDNADMRDYIRRLLEQHWSVTAVGDGAAALAEARREPPDLVLSDVMMPGLDGFALLSALRADKRTASVPVVLVSARAGEEARVEGLSAGADDYLVKPFSARELVARVRTHLALAQARRRSERTSEELYTMLMQVPAAIMLRRGPELRVEFQNALSAQVFDQRGKTLRETWPDTNPAWLAQLDRVMNHGETVVELELPATRAWEPGRESTRYFDLTWAPWRLPDGTIDGVVTVSFDVTDRVQSRRNAVVAEQRRRLAFDAADVGTWRIDLGTQLTTRDAPLNRILGLAEVESTDPVADYLERIHVDDRARVIAGMEAATQDTRDYVQELRIVRPDGDVRWMRAVGRVVHDEQGRPAVFTGATVDITERRLAEDAALAASRAKDEFLAMLGHELRNPLAPIVTALDVMRLRGDPATRERLMIERHVTHLTRLVDDLLDISRVTRGLIELERERVSIRDVVMKAIEIASPLMEQKGHHVDVALPKDLWVDGDPVRLAQVFANLLTNAARYTPKAGKIAIAAQREGDRIRVEVIDSGIGIPAEMVGPIFDLFVQGGRTVARSEGGLGIGLALVRTLVQMHGGEVAAASAGVGQGSTFTVELPALERGVVVAPPTPAPIREVQGLKVLVVDDNVDAAELLGEALRTFGHDVLIAHDGPQALQILDRFQPDAAVLDIGLPVMDGYELAQRLRERGLAGCRFIAVTGYGQKQDIDKSRQAGFHEHMTKPVDLRNLVRALDATST